MRRFKHAFVLMAGLLAVGSLSACCGPYGGCGWHRGGYYHNGGGGYHNGGGGGSWNHPGGGHP